MEDHRIVALYWQRSQDAIHHTQEKYQSYLTKVSYNILADHEDSLECVNDTYLAAWNSMPPQKPSILSTYLAKITRQISIDRYRKRHTAKRQASEYALSLAELETLVSGGSTPEEVLDAHLLDEAISRFLGTLSSDARNLFLGRYYFFDPLKEVADYCGMSQAKAKSMLFRTRQSLKAYLIKEGFDL